MITSAAHFTKKLVAAMMLGCGALLLTHAATASSDDTPQMTSDRNDTVRIVKYKFSYRLTDGTEVVEQGSIKNAGTEAEWLSVSGTFRWIDKVRGFIRIFSYVADEKGFRITGQSGIASVHPNVVASLLG